jgi:hypothetical protein
MDPETFEDKPAAYDMTVFVKNPNTYKQHAGLDFNENNVPGWTTPEGYKRPGLTVGWGHTGENEDMPVDCMFQTWGGSYRVEQTIEDLPAGIYTIQYGFSERGSEADNEGNYAYATTSDGLEYTEVAKVHGQAFSFADEAASNVVIPDVAVSDGILTIGVNAGDASHTFFNEVRLYINLPIEGYDYAADLAAVKEMIESGVESKTVAPAKVRALELYDLNGRRIISAKPGVAIVKKYMSDGTVRVEKVVKK